MNLMCNPIGTCGGCVLVKCVSATVTRTVQYKLYSFKRQKHSSGFIPSLSENGEFYTEGVQGLKTSAIKEGIYGGQRQSEEWRVDRDEDTAVFGERTAHRHTNL